MLDRTKVLATATALLAITFVTLPVAQGQANANEIQTQKESVAPVTVEQVALETAHDYIGTRYCRGGKTPRCFDCSGFIKYVYAQQGIELPPTTHGQYDVAKHVDAADVRPGDLVFFHTSKGWIYHVGIYVGDGKVLHSPRYGARVRIESIWTSKVNYGRI